MQDPSLSADLYRATVEPLIRNDADQGTQLVATLTAFFEERGNLIATAKRLFVHRHTLTSRLERIEELTGRSLRCRLESLLLDLGLRAEETLPAGRIPAASSHEAGGVWMDGVSKSKLAMPDHRSASRAIKV